MSSLLELDDSPLEPSFTLLIMDTIIANIQIVVLWCMLFFVDDVIPVRQANSKLDLWWKALWSTGLNGSISRTMAEI